MSAYLVRNEWIEHSSPTWKEGRLATILISHIWWKQKVLHLPDSRLSLSDRVCLMWVATVRVARGTLSSRYITLWSRRSDSNRRPDAYKATALTNWAKAAYGWGPRLRSLHLLSIRQVLYYWASPHCIVNCGGSGGCCPHDILLKRQMLCCWATDP